MAINFFATSQTASAQVQGPFVARVTSGLTAKDATWTESVTGTYKYEYTYICANYLYSFLLLDETPGYQNELLNFTFTNSIDGCAAGAPTVQLTAGHNYRITLDVIMGPIPTACEPGVDLCRAKIHFDCTGN
ncbi:hypothetical protein HZB60_00600 [candidate division KSB1 bacterium]|nr:hypothetical protein [candidate division KSB1 bacterium]